MPRRTTRKKKKSFGSQRRARASREYVQTPMARAIPKRAIRAGRGYGMSMGAKCALLYGKSLVDPSGENSKGACLPVGFPMPSQKIRAFVRGFISTGTTGDGFISWTPVLANDAICTTFTTATSVGTATSLLTGGGSGFTNTATAVMSKLPYTGAQITGGAVQGRLVSGCLRTRYAGNENVRSGVVSLFEDPDHLSIATQSAQSISLFDSCGKERVYGTGDWHQINWSGPRKMQETEYREVASYIGFPVIAIAINGTLNGAGTPGPATFEYEIWENLEYLGRDVVGKTANHMDEGLSKTLMTAAMDAQSQSEPFNPKNPGAVRDILRGKPGGTLAGDLIHAGIGAAFGQGAAQMWGRVRESFNPNYARPYSTVAPSRRPLAIGWK